jgi:hypothetical protein
MWICEVILEVIGVRQDAGCATAGRTDQGEQRRHARTVVVAEFPLISPERISAPSERAD